MGPILAVQAQKALEALRKRTDRKVDLFTRLMATRAARLSQEHVRALNLIEIVFHGRLFFSRWLHRSADEKAVLDAWKQYHDHLTTNFPHDQLALWVTTGDNLFTNLLSAMAKDVGFVYDTVQIKKGAYVPVAHGNLEDQEAALRAAALDILRGDKALHMNVVAFPVNEAAAAQHRETVKKLGEALSDGKLAVHVADQPNGPAT